MTHGGARRSGVPFLTLRRREALVAWLFVSPTVVGFLIFFVGPLLAVFYYATTEWNLLSGESTFIGFENFADALTRNPDFWGVMRNSVIFAIGLVPLNMALALMLAVALSRPRRGVVFFRTVFFAPVITSAVAWAIVWKFLLQGEAGLAGMTWPLGPDGNGSASAGFCTRVCARVWCWRVG